MTLFAGPGSDPRLGVECLDLRRPQVSAAARADVSMRAPEWLDEHHAYLDLMVRLARTGADEFDVIHNHSLHYLPIAMAADRARPGRQHAAHAADAVAGVRDPGRGSDCPRDVRRRQRAHRRRVVARHPRRARDPQRRRRGSLVRPARAAARPVWFGRIVPEKGPHLAIDAAVLAGQPLRLAGPIADRAYFEREIAPRLALAGRRVRGASDAGRARAARGGGVRRARHAVLGRAVRARRRRGARVRDAGVRVRARRAAGAAGATCGRLVAPGDVRGLAAAIGERAGLSRAAAREHAVRECSLERMVDRYVELYGALARRRRVIGYYVHHQGDGHVTRAAAIAERSATSRSAA